MKTKIQIETRIHNLEWTKNKNPEIWTSLSEIELFTLRWVLTNDN